MKSAFLTRSGSFQSPNQLHIGSRSGSDISVSGIFSLRRSISISPRCALHIDLKMRNESKATTSNPLRRARSDTDLVVSDRPSRIWSPPVTLPEEGEEDRSILRGSAAAVIVPAEEIEFAGGGSGGGIKIGGGGGGGGGGEDNEKKKIENYYQQMLRLDPSNPLLLRNYGKFLHEVEGDVKGAEECYGRAILASPKDGEVLSLYGKLVWETEKDKDRAADYFQRAVEASPDDCSVLGSYASFLWDIEEDEEEEETMKSSSPPLVEAW